MDTVQKSVCGKLPWRSCKRNLHGWAGRLALTKAEPRQGRTREPRFTTMKAPRASMPSLTMQPATMRLPLPNVARTCSKRDMALSQIEIPSHSWSLLGRR